MAGDGGTADIGIQGLSGAAERNTDLLFICYDNEAYMNTGTQRSGLTPIGAKTSTTPAKGKLQFPKDMPAVLEAHGIPYIATASAGYPGDLYDKVKKARAMSGTRYMHLSAPCPPGWQFPASDTVAVAKRVIETGMFVLFEIEQGVFRLTGRSLKIAEDGITRPPIHELITGQKRFKGVEEETIEQYQQYINSRWERFVKRHFDAKD